MGDINFIDNLKNNILYPQDSTIALLSGLSIALFANFRWTLPKKIDILNIEYSNYTMYNKDITSSLVLKQNTFSVSGIRQLDKINTYTVNIVTNTLLLKLIRSYSSNGGLFTCITPIGLIANLAIKNLNVSFDNGTTPTFNFEFQQLNVNAVEESKSMSLRAAVCL